MVTDIYKNEIHGKQIRVFPLRICCWTFSEDTAFSAIIENIPDMKVRRTPITAQ